MAVCGVRCRCSLNAPISPRDNPATRVCRLCGLDNVLPPIYGRAAPTTTAATTPPTPVHVSASESPAVDGCVTGDGAGAPRGHLSPVEQRRRSTIHPHLARQ